MTQTKKKRLSENGSERNVQMNRRTKMKFSINYKDIEISIRLFSDNDAYNIEKWTNDFEEIAIIFNWTEV